MPIGMMCHHNFGLFGLLKFKTTYRKYKSNIFQTNLSFQLRELNALSSGSGYGSEQRQWRLQRERLHNDLTKALNTFQVTFFTQKLQRLGRKQNN